MESETPLVPARRLNEWTYCPRLGILEWVHAEFAASADTVDGTWQHRRTDQPGPELPPGPAREEEEEEGDDPPAVTRSVWLTDEEEGLTAKIDLVEVASGEAVPVDTKRGKPAPVPERVWEPERVQLCAQGILLRRHGWRSDHGEIYFAGSRRRVAVAFDDALVARTRELAAQFREAAASGELPEPLADSPKCPRCSLVGICLPDETRLLAEAAGAGRPRQPKEEPRQLLAPRDEGLPLHVTVQGARVGVGQGELVVSKAKEELARARLRDTNQVSVYGMVQVTTQALRAAMEAGIPVCYFSHGGWFSGMATGHGHKNVVARRAQFAVAADDERSLAVAREIVRSKIRNQRVLLRRNHREPAKAVLQEMSRLSRVARRAGSLERLLGIEGAAARLYFEHFGGMLKGAEDLAGAFAAAGRNRRPPRDPVNALLSFVYSLLVKELTVACRACGLDPYMGLYHQPRYGKPALALDLMEEFRPLVADSVVIGAINNGEVEPASFLRRAGGCNLTGGGRRAFLRAYERRLDQMIAHPLFGYRTTWRRVMAIQARLLSRHLLGEIERYVPMETR